MTAKWEWEPHHPLAIGDDKICAWKMAFSIVVPISRFSTGKKRDLVAPSPCCFPPWKKWILACALDPLPNTSTRKWSSRYQWMCNHSNQGSKIPIFWIENPIKHHHFWLHPTKFPMNSGELPVKNHRSHLEFPKLGTSRRGNSFVPWGSDLDFTDAKSDGTSACYGYINDFYDRFK